MKKKIMYINNRGPYSIGAITHQKALEEIYGSQNIYVIDFYNISFEEKINYKSYGKNRNPLEYLHRSFQGNIGCISNRIIDDICNLIQANNIQIVFCEESAFGNLFKEIKRKISEITIICFYHDISGDLFRQRRKQLPLSEFHHKYILSTISIQQEKISQAVCDQNWVFNNADYKRFYDYYKKYPDAVIPMGGNTPNIPSQFKNIIIKENDPKSLFFVCSTGYVNINGFKWFYENIVPRLDFDYSITIVGTGSRELYKIVNNDKIKIIGKVDSLDEYYLNTDIVIAPIFDGGGMKVKTLEALSYGKITIGTPESLHGYWEKIDNGLKQSLVFNCKNIEEWVLCLNKLGRSEIKKYNSQLYEVCKESFSHNATVRYFTEALKKISLI